MASDTTKFESAQALFCSIADYIGQTKIENVLNVTNTGLYKPKDNHKGGPPYKTFAAFLKGSQLKPKETNLEIAEIAYARCDTPEMSFAAIKQFLKNDSWYQSSVWTAKHLIKELSAVSKLTNFDVLDDRGYKLGFRYVRGDKKVMTKIESLYSICNEANKAINKLAGASKEMIFGNVNKWSPADIYFASKKAIAAIEKELTKAEKAKKYYFGGRGGLNIFISRLIASGDLLPLSLKKVGKKVTIEKVNFNKKTKATILENINYESKDVNENSYDTSSNLWLTPPKRLGSDANGTPLQMLDKKGNLSKIAKWKKQPGPFTVGKAKPETFTFQQIFKMRESTSTSLKKKGADIVNNKMTKGDKKIYKDFEYMYLEHLDKKVKISRVGEVPISWDKESRDMVIPIVDMGGASKGNIQMRHDPSGKYGSWKVDFKYTGAGARGGSMVSFEIFSAALKMYDPTAGADFHAAWKKGMEIYAAAKDSPNGDAPDVYKSGPTGKKWQYYGPRGLENDPPIYLTTECRKAENKTGYNRARLKKLRWKGKENAFDYQRGELSAIILINHVMPIMTKFWRTKKKRPTPTSMSVADQFCQMIFKYVTSRSDTSARFVIAK